MRVLQISSASSIGGGERHLIDISNHLTRRGHEIFLAVVAESPLTDQLNEVPSDRIITLTLRNAIDVQSAIKIARLVRAEDIHLINAHLARDYPIAALAARLAGIPFVITRHVLFPMSRLHRIVLRKAAFVIAPSNAVAENLRREKIFAPEKITTIRYGLDVHGFPEQPRSEHNGFRVGAVGNLDPVKGFDVLIRAAAMVSESDPSITFEIVGEDRSEDGRNRKDLEELIASLGLEKVVELSGWSNDVSKRLAEFDVFVSTSRSESFGFVIAEAMLTGVPVIATETEGAKEIVADLPLGILVPMESPEALARAIGDLRNDPMKRRQLAKFGRRHVEENFSLKRTIDQTEDLYKRAIR